jgi:DNA-directed RNA polymerase specialized sigma24 family protein
MAVHSAVFSASTFAHTPISGTTTWIPWTRILEIGQAAAVAIGLKGEYLKDCAMDFVVSITSASTGREDLSEETLKEKAAKFARNMALRLRRHNQRVTSLDEVTEEGNAHAIPEPVSREPGPVELLQSADFLSRLLAPLGNFGPAQQHLFVERILRLKRLVDLAEETGRSANALAQSISNILKRLRDMLAENGIDMEEINDRLSQLHRRHGI